MTKNTKTSTQRSSNANTQGLFSRILLRLGSLSTNAWMVILACAVLGSIGLYFAYRQYAIVQDRKQFERAEIVVDQLYADIVKELGEPTESTKDKSCSYASTKFSRGTRGCGVSISYNYQTSATMKPIDFGRKIASIVPSENVMISHSSIEGKKYESLDPEYSANIELKSILTSKSCYISVIEDSLSSRVKIITGCSGHAQAEYYPVRD